MRLRNGVAYSPAEIERDGLEVIDESIVRHKGMTRLATHEPTAFQTLLAEINQGYYQWESSSLAGLATDLFKVNLVVPPFMHVQTDQTLINSYNDNSKRFFETVFAKKLLLSTMKLNNCPLALLIAELKNFLMSCNPDKKFLQAYQTAKLNLGPVLDESLEYYRNIRLDLLNLVHGEHFGTASPLLIDLYDLHYLTHQISNLSSYKDAHPQGILNIYPHHTYFQKLNRGRISGYGLISDSPSYNLGIFRSIDKTPTDLRKDCLATKETRCPDRLYMEHPKVAREHVDNWQHKAFANPLGRGYVNGLSGSIVLELRLILFFVSSIKQGRYVPQLVNVEQLECNEYDLLKKYYLMITGLFVYFEGGHTIAEILNVFHLPEVIKTVNETLDRGPNQTIFSVEKFFHEDPRILILLKESLTETAKFYHTQQLKAAVHEEIQKTPRVRF